MTHIAYVTVQSYHRNQLDEHVKPCYVEYNIRMIVDNILIRHIYAVHPMVLVIHNLWNTDMNLTTFSQYFSHVPLVVLVQSWSTQKVFFASIKIWTVVTKNKIPLSIHLRSNVPNESTLKKSSLKLIWVLSISLTF